MTGDLPELLGVHFENPDLIKYSNTVGHNREVCVCVCVLGQYSVDGGISAGKETLLCCA